MEPAVGGGRALARQRPGRRLLPADAPLSSSLARARGGALSPSALRDRRVGSAPISQGGERLRRGSAPRRRGVRGLADSRPRSRCTGITSARSRTCPAIAALARSGLRTRASILALAALIGLQAMAGSPEMSAASIALAAGLAWRPRAPFPEPVAPTPRFVTLRRCGAAIALGLALAAWVLVPMGELGLHSDRRSALPAAERDLGAVGQRDAAVARGILSPVLRRRVPRFALSAAVRPRRGGRGVRRITGGASRSPSRWSPPRASLSRGPGPPGAWLRAIPPLDRVRYAGKGLAWTAFGVAMLSGLGLDALRFSARGVRARAGFGLAAVAALLAAALAPLPLPVRLACGVGSAAVGVLALGLGARPAWGALFCRNGGRGPRRGLDPRARGHSSLCSREPSSDFARSSWNRSRGSPAASSRRRWRPLAAWTAARRSVRRRHAAAPTRGRPRLHEPDLPDSHGADRRADDDGGIGGDAGLAGAAGHGAARRRRERPGAVDAVSSANLAARKIGDFYRAPLGPYRPRLSFVRELSDRSGRVARLAAGRLGRSRPRPGGPARPTARDPIRPDRSDATPLLVAHLAEDSPERRGRRADDGELGAARRHRPALSGLDRRRGRPAPADSAGRRVVPRRRSAGRHAHGWSSAIGRTPFYAGAARLRRGSAHPPRPLAPGRAHPHGPADFVISRRSTRPCPVSRSRASSASSSGSFLNVVIHRLPNEKSPSSRRPRDVRLAGARIAPFDNVPVLSWIVLGGRCRSCRASIAIRYPLIELANGVALGARRPRRAVLGRRGDRRVSGLGLDRAAGDRLRLPDPARL